MRGAVSVCEITREPSFEHTLYKRNLSSCDQLYERPESATQVERLLDFRTTEVAGTGSVTILQESTLFRYVRVAFVLRFSSDNYLRKEI
jgi:hypothetical protein